MQTKFRISGVRELQRRLRRLKETSAEGVIRPALRAAAQPLASEIRGNSPQSTVTVQDAPAAEDGRIAAEVVVSDRGTPAQRQAVHDAFRHARPDAEAIGREMILHGIERELRS